MKAIKLRPSAAERWIACPGSASLCASMPKIDTVYNQEGTAAHKLAELCLKTNKDPQTCLGNGIWTKENHQERVTQNMIDAVQEYLCFIEDLEGNYKGVEEKLDFSTLSPLMSKGTADHICYNSKEKLLTVTDYKHGVGTVVDPERNAQLMLYAFGAARKVWEGLDGEKNKIDPKTLFNTIRIVVVQPRSINDDNIKTWDTTFKQIFDWAYQVAKEAANRIEKGDTTLLIGDHCKFCDAKAVCTKQNDLIKDVVKVDPASPKIVPPEQLSIKDINKILPHTDNLISYLKAIKEHALVLADSGTKLEGFKLVRGKSNRKWIEQEDAIEALQEYLGEETYEKKVLTVAKAEKALKKIKASPEVVLEGLWEKPIGALKLVPISDKGKEVKPSVCEDFGLIEDNALDPDFWG